MRASNLVGAYASEDRRQRDEHMLRLRLDGWANSGLALAFGVSLGRAQQITKRAAKVDVFAGPRVEHARAVRSRLALGESIESIAADRGVQPHQLRHLDEHLAENARRLLGADMEKHRAESSENPPTAMERMALGWWLIHMGGAAALAT